MAALAGGVAVGWRDALSMPADLALALLESRADWAEAGEPPDAPRADEGPRVRDNGDGSRSVSFGSIDALRAHLRAGGQFGGVVFGGG